MTRRTVLGAAAAGALLAMVPALAQHPAPRPKGPRVWLDAGLPPMPMAVNISAIEFRSDAFVETIRAVLKETRLDPQCLELELTESVLMKHAESTVSMLNKPLMRSVRSMAS